MTPSWLVPRYACRPLSGLPALLLAGALVVSADGQSLDDSSAKAAPAAADQILRRVQNLKAK